MESVLVHHGEDRWHFGDLVADRLGIITGEGVAAEAAFWRLAVDDLADLFGGDKGAGLAVMAGLSASLLARGRGRGRRLTEGGSDEGGWEELVEFLPRRSSRSAIRFSRECTSPETAACASGESVSQRVCGIGG